MSHNGVAAPVLGQASLIDLDAELFEALDAERRAGARRHAVVPVARLEPGTWDPASVTLGAMRPFAALVAEGVLVSEVVLGASVAAELVGPGDVVDVVGSDGDLLPAVHRWSTAAPVTIAVLDAHLLPALRAWPSVAAGLTARAAARSRRLEVQRAISQLPRVEERLVALFGHLAERFGRVVSGGIVLPIALTHQMLGRLVGARRPTVSLALKELGAAGALQRRGDGSWFLAREALDVLATDPEAAPPPRPADAAAVTTSVAARVDPRISAMDVSALLDRCRLLGVSTESLHQRTALTLARAGATRDEVRARRVRREVAAGDERSP